MIQTKRSDPPARGEGLADRRGREPRSSDPQRTNSSTTEGHVNVVDDFPHEVREIEQVWIPMRDGCRLAARLWLPDEVERIPAPAVIEYIPYGKRLGTRDRDEAMHRWFAGHGLAAVRIDLRGSGESEGVLRDEYLPQEQEDGVEAIRWIAAQPWCTGAVGLIGKSWGGFNALQIAARRPPELRGIVTVCSTDDRYADDVHYMGGCLLNDNLWWGATFFQLVAQPPDPELVGSNWRAMWLERLEAAEPLPVRWLQHPLADAYWKQGSVREDYGAIACPVFAVGGWGDGYRNAIPRLLSGLRAPCRGLIGPWGHAYPHDANPGPSIGFLQEALRWWRSCLGEANGDSRPGWREGTPQLPSENEPRYRVWMPESVPAGFRGDRPGRWVAEESWPTQRIENRVLRLAPDRLGNTAASARLVIASPQTTGRASGGWLVAGLRDQREDDAHSLCFDSEPLVERLEILGGPEVKIVVASDRPAAFLVARLCDVSPEGSSTRVSYGVLNLTHHAGHETCQPLEPGRPVEVTVRLKDVAHAFPPGHRLRLALSNACWPLLWPSPEPVRLTVFTERSTFSLPVRPPDPNDANLRAFAPPEQARSSEWSPVTEGGYERQVETDPLSHDQVIRTRSGFDEHGSVALSRLEAAGNIEGGDGSIIEIRSHPDDPLRARASMVQRTELRRGTWRVSVETEIQVACTKTEFVVAARLDAWEGDDRVFHRGWDERVPRLGL
jgi:predicted acyl esterase